MIVLAWYLLRVIICSGILCGYYFLALRNKAFHRWNRFYLLAAVVISLLAPLMKINIFQNGEGKGAVVQVLQTISYGDEAVVEYNRNSSFQISTENIAEAAYLLFSATLLAIFFISLYKIVGLKKKYPETKIKGVSFINTDAKGTPFSFFKSIFWNSAIDLHSRPGQQIFNHEIAHIKEKHSYDKIFMNIVLIFFWINPFFWLMRKELNMIHEFVADKEALEDSDISAFSEMVLQIVYPGQNFSLTNNFFYSPLKRRILMLTKNKNPKVSYVSRLLVLPLAAIVFFAFTLKVKNKNATLYDGKTITVIIDAGHGGADEGAVSANGVKEKDITLGIAKKIAALNMNSHIKILLSRENDQYISLKDRVAFARNIHADMFISIHVDKSVNKQINGFCVLIDKNNSEQNILLGSTLISELKKSYKTADKIAMRKNKGIMVLDSNSCPAVLIECGVLSNSADAAFISNSANQEKIAENILNGIENYATQNLLNKSDTATLRSEDRVSSSKDENSIRIEGNAILYDSINKITGKANSIIIQSMDKENNLNMHADGSKVEIVSKLSDTTNPIYYVDGKEISNKEMKKIPADNIYSINVLKDKSAEKKYGAKGKNGVIEIYTKNKMENTTFVNADGKTIFEVPDNKLIIIDGKESPNSEFKKINPNDIESVTILKGENAVKIYGLKAKNGVIRIMTKKGIENINKNITVTNRYYPS
jgi:TonB-dependent SusC/RagA subfamily outer membrane receptor